MQLTPEQQAQVDQAKAEGRRRVVLTPTPEQSSDYARRVEIEEAGREENIRWAQKRREARNELGFSGDLRRAIAATRKPAQSVAAEIGVDGDLLDRFCCGEAELPTDIVDRLVKYLGLQLMQPIR
jgi:hypothetical protein